MALTNAAAGFIGASVTLVLVIIFMILMVILVRQCLAFVSKRNAIRAQMEHQRQIREQIRQRRGSVTEPIPATFDWHHSIRIAGTPPPSYVEAKDLPTFDDETEGEEQNKVPTSNGKVAVVGVESEGISKVAQANGVHMGPAQVLGTEVVVVQVEQNGNSNGVSPQNPQENNRTFTTSYTEFSSA